MRILVIGGVAAGMSAASQAKRRLPEAEVIVFERGPHVSYGACGMPYNIADPKREMDDLVVMTAETFRNKRHIDVRTGHEVTAIHPDRHQITVRDLTSGQASTEPYDRLIIATGAAAVRPPIDGLDGANVFVLRQLTDGDAIKRYIADQAPRRAVIIGAGYIGMEMAEALAERGLSVTVLEGKDQVVPGFAPEIAEQVHEELTRNNVTVITGVRVERLDHHDGATRVMAGQTAYPADLVLVCTGVRPNTRLAERAGIALGPTGAIAVDRFLATNRPDIFAAGDCAEAWHRIADAPAYIPLGTTANKQGKLAGANATGAGLVFPGIDGTAGFRVFDLEVARTGLGPEQVDPHSAVTALSRQRSRGHGFPGAATLTTLLLMEQATGKLLGAQMVGAEGVALRIDVLATALRAGMTVAEIETLDLAYAPPFAPVYDPVLIAATVGHKAIMPK